MYVVCILFIVIVLPITCYRLRGCLWYEKRKEHMVRLLLRQKLWEAKNPEEAAKRADAEEKLEAARAAKRGVTFRRGDGGDPSSSALVAPVPPPARPPPQRPPVRQLPPPPPPAPAATYSADEEAGAPPAAAKPGAFARMRNAFGGGGPRPAQRMETPLGGGGGAAPAPAAAADEYIDDDDYSGSEYTESTFTGVTQSQTATSVGVSQPPSRAVRK